MVYDKMLQEKLREMQALTEWRDDELAKCKTQKEQSIAMFAKLKTELDEMHSIANPSVSMDVKDGKLHTVSLVQEVSINQHLKIAVDSTGEDNIDGHHRHKAHHIAKAKDMTETARVKAEEEVAHIDHIAK